jgi:lysophospholipid acyltransferase (LPLAT)-like uncharacterized protein
MTSFSNHILGNGLYMLGQITRRTASYQVQGQDHFESSIKKEAPVIWVAWHGMTMMLAGYVLRHYSPESLIIMMPDDWRGDALAHWATKIGARPWRMNLKGDASMGTARKLAEMVRLLRKGQDAYVTPDGPDGPAYQIKPGVAYLAKKTKATLLPVGAFTRTGYRVNRWDQYVVPRPFSRISVVVGEPFVPEDTQDLDDIALILTDKLHRVSAQAIANYYGQKS